MTALAGEQIEVVRSSSALPWLPLERSGKGL